MSSSPQLDGELRAGLLEAAARLESTTSGARARRPRGAASPRAAACRARARRRRESSRSPARSRATVRHSSSSICSMLRAVSNSCSGRRTSSSAMSRKYIARKLAGSSSPRFAWRSTGRLLGFLLLLVVLVASARGLGGDVGRLDLRSRRASAASSPRARPTRLAAASSSRARAAPADPSRRRAAEACRSQESAAVPRGPYDARHPTGDALRRVDRPRSLRATAAFRRSRFPRRPCLCSCSRPFFGILHRAVAAVRHVLAS